MADATEAPPPPPKMAGPKPVGTVSVPITVLATMGLAVAGLIAAYVFVTQPVFAAHAKAESDRATKLESTVAQHDDSLKELRGDVKVIDQNLRTLMQRQGVPSEQITPSPSKE